MRYEELTIEGRNAVLRHSAGKFPLTGLSYPGRMPGRPVEHFAGSKNTILIITFVPKEYWTRCLTLPPGDNRLWSSL